MFDSLCHITFRNVRKYIAISCSFAHLHRPFSSSSSSILAKNSSTEQSAVVSYLENSCGLSPEKALSASKYLDLGIPKEADLVLAVLKQHQFSDTQIATIIWKRSKLLRSRPEKILAPKIEFLEYIGVPRSAIPSLLCTAPNILASSLKKQIIPSYNLLDNFLYSREDVVFAINKYPDILATSLDVRVLPNIEILRDAGVPDSGIQYCMKFMPSLLSRRKPEQLKKYVEKVKRVGFTPEKNMFFQGLKVLALSSTYMWNHKIEVYKKCGWSEEQVIDSFRRFPLCMCASESKITEVVNILVHKMGYQVSDLVRYPVVILMSLEKRIVPRSLVYERLVLKGLAKKNLSLTYWLICTEKSFLGKFVWCHEKEAPDLLKLYRKKEDYQRKRQKGTM